MPNYCLIFTAKELLFCVDQSPLGRREAVPGDPAHHPRHVAAHRVQRVPAPSAGLERHAALLPPTAERGIQQW